MADRRRVRSSSRRITPTPQPPARQATAEPTPTKRVTRSQSHEVDDDVVVRASKRSTRGQVRGRTVELETSNEPEGNLSIVQEVEDDDERPQTPPPVDRQTVVPHRSPGGASEMSGTTAISSLSMADAEDLDAELIIEHIDDLYSACRKFLDVLVPERGDDLSTIKGLRMPGSRLSEKFRMRDEALDVHLDVFRKPPHQYIKRQAVLQALFGKDDLPSSPSTAELVMFKANLVVFAKQMVTSQREQEPIWYALRELDISFPSLFLSAFVGSAAASVGDSKLLSDTFSVALEIRTQLAILVLLRASEREEFEPDETLAEVFFTAVDNSEDMDFRGWELAALGGSGTQLSQELRTRIQQRVEAIRRYFNRDTPSLENGEFVDFDNLTNRYDWDQFILTVLNWVRLRNREIESIMRKAGGIDGVVEALKDQVASPQTRIRYSLPARPSPKKEQKSTETVRQHGRRSFDPNTSLDPDALDFLKQKTRELRDSDDLLPSNSTRPVHAMVHQPRREIEVHGAEQDDERPVLGEDDEEPEDLEPEHSRSSAPPTSSAAIISRIKKREIIEKENARRRFIDPQPNPVRVQFGDGFDESQPTHQSSPRKRRRERNESPEADSDSDSIFVQDDRSLRTAERREKAPLRKKARFFPEPSSSAVAPQSSAPVLGGSVLVPRSSALVPRSSAPVPPSNQTTQRSHKGKEPVRTAQSSSSSNRSITPAREDNYSDVNKLAKQQSKLHPAPRSVTATNESQDRVRWSEEEVVAFKHYMELFPRKYARIKEYDAAHGSVLERRTQVNLKDKAVNMAMDYIKSGQGLPPGFESVITPATQRGKDLIARGFTDWYD